MQIDRRTVLKGFGATLALPFLESMMPQGVLAASVPKTPIRTAFIFVPNGINMQHWVPSGNELPYTLQPLQSLKNKFNIVSGLAQRNAFALGDGAGDHARSAAAWLTGCHPRKTSP
jgi:hypothetical protein